MKTAISTRDELSQQIKNLTLRAETVEKQAGKLKTKLLVSLSDLAANKKQFESQLAQIRDLTSDVEALKALREELEANVKNLLSKVSRQDEQIITERKISKTSRARMALFNKQIRALRAQISLIAQTLEASEQIAIQQRVRIVNLGKRLNAALASKVQELSRYRSEFFGRLRDVLGSQPGIRIVGDRFVFQSEVLFGKGSDQLGDKGRSQMEQLAGTLKTITAKIPTNIDWILRVDGHTDQVPIKTARFPSNWELSTARAISVVKFLIEQGVSPANLAATGFGEFQPIDSRDAEEAYNRNRRIELKLTQR